MHWHTSLAQTPSPLPAPTPPKAIGKGNLARLHSAFFRGVKASIKSTSRAKTFPTPVNSTFSGQPLQLPLAPHGESGSCAVAQLPACIEVSSGVKTGTKPPIPPKPEGSPWASRVRQGSQQRGIHPKLPFKAGATAAETMGVKRISQCSTTLCGAPLPACDGSHELGPQRKAARIVRQGPDMGHGPPPVPRCPCGRQCDPQCTTPSAPELQCLLPRIEAWIRTAAREYAANFQTSLTLDSAEVGVQGKGKATATMSHLLVQEACDTELSVMYQSGRYRFPVTFQDLIDLELGKISEWMVEEVEAERQERVIAGIYGNGRAGAGGGNAGVR